MRPHENGPTGRRTRGQVDDRDRRVAPIADVEVRGVGDDRVGPVADGDRAAPGQRGGVDQVHRVAQVSHDRHEPARGDECEPRREQPRARIGERDGVGAPPRAALPGQPVHPVAAAAARPHGVAPVAASAREPEPRRLERQPPHHAAGERVDAHHPVLAVSVVRHEHRAIGEGDEVERQGTDADLATRRTDTPAGGEQRGSVRLRPGGESSGDEAEACDDGHGEQGEQSAFEHGQEYRRSREPRQPLSLQRQ